MGRYNDVPSPLTQTLADIACCCAAPCSLNGSWLVTIMVLSFGTYGTGRAVRMCIIRLQTLESESLESRHGFGSTEQSELDFLNSVS